MKMSTYFKKQTFNDSQFPIDFVKTADVKIQNILEKNMKSKLIL